MQNQPTLFDRVCSRLWLILAIGVGVLVLGLFAAGTATAAVPSGIWSDARQTYEIKKLKSQNIKQAVKIRRLKKDVAILREDTRFLQDFVLCHATWDAASVMNTNHTLGDRGEACARIGL